MLTVSLRKKLCKINYVDIVLYRSVTASRICKLRLNWKDIFAAGALFTIKFDFWLNVRVLGKNENYLHGFFAELRTLARLLTVSVRQVGAVYTDRTYLYS